MKYKKLELANYAMFGVHITGLDCNRCKTWLTSLGGNIHTYFEPHRWLLDSFGVHRRKILGALVCDIRCHVCGWNESYSHIAIRDELYFTTTLPGYKPEKIEKYV